MSKHACVICFEELPRAQRTCGKRACLDAWKHLSDPARKKHVNAASYPASQRALLLAQGPTPEELEERRHAREALKDQIEAEEAAQAKKGPGPSLRDLLNPDNYKPKGGDTVNVENELPSEEGKTQD